ncbi:hypothetical protein AURDEDRAFT_172531 [Auricularia subglabra TFB-10046 SS5]|nr:hypothetical protein AURDEDRAFT_172531 [Auricularia subglabra TFB-10046 SS5]
MQFPYIQDLVWVEETRFFVSSRAPDCEAALTLRPVVLSLLDRELGFLQLREAQWNEDLCLSAAGNPGDAPIPQAIPQPGTLATPTTLPIKPYAYYSLKECISAYLSDSAIEEALASSARILNQTVSAPLDAEAVIRDIRHGSVFTTFFGPDGKTKYFSTSGDDLRLAFSLSVDWFHPRRSKKRGVSLGIISVACLNLPPDVRYAPENLFIVGILPGPKETDVQPFLGPLVDELLTLWEPGIYFPQTALSPAGRRLLRLPYWDPTQFFVVDGMHNLFLGLVKTHVRYVWEIDVASKKSARRRKVNPKGRVKFNFPTSSATAPAVAAERPEALAKAERLMAKISDEDRWRKLCNHPLPVLRKMCTTRNLAVPSAGQEPLRKEYVAALRTQWTQLQANSPSRQGGSASAIPSATDALPRRASAQEPSTNRQSATRAPRGPSNPYKMSPSDLEHVQDIISSLSTPSWLGRVAKDFGSASHGAPKADEWRTAATVQLPIALTVMWYGTERESELNWFLDLSTAVQIATAQSTSQAKAGDYLKFMRSYLTGMVSRGFPLKPNHHAALHLAPFLPAFGPIRGWWTFPVERQIGVLQRINTNNRLGTLPVEITYS